MTRRTASRVSFAAGLLILTFALFGLGASIAKTEPPKALLVVGSTALGPGDRAIKARLEKLGYAVLVQPSEKVSAHLADGKAVVLLSASARAEAVRGAFAEVPVPVLVWNPALFGHLGLTGRDRGVDFGETAASGGLSMASVSHPMTAGLGGLVEVSGPGASFGWGVPTANALWIATLPHDANKTAILAYERGVEMVGRKAPARRVGFFTAGDTPAALTRQGWLLFESALRWVTAKNAPPVVSAGVDLELASASDLTLEGSVTDDGIPEGRGLEVGWSVVSGPDQVSFADGSRARTAARFPAPGVYVLRLSAGDGQLVSSADVTVKVRSLGKGGSASPASPTLNVPSGTPLLMITGSTTLTAGEVALRTRLQNLGYTVTVRTGLTYAAATDLPGKKVVLITATAGVPDVNTKFRDVTVGVVNMRTTLFNQNGLTGSVANTDYGVTSGAQVAIDSAASSSADPMAAGLSSTVTVLTAAAALNWGVPNTSAVSVAAIPAAGTHSAIFRYVPGAPMVGNITAAGRRVGLFVSDPAASKLTTTGGGPLFDNAVNWAGGFSNARPQVLMGADHSALIAPQDTPLTATVLDDGTPGPLSYNWTVVSCAGSVTFGNASAKDTTASFTAAAAGSTCTLRLTASDGALSNSADVRIAVYAQNSPPTVNAGADQAVDWAQTQAVNVAGTAGDDGLPYPPGALSYTWSKFSGPGAVTFADPTGLATTATFSALGSYVLRLTASDGQLSASDDMAVNVTGTVLLVVGNPMQTSDPVMKSRIEALGYSVVTKVADQWLVAGDSAGKTLVVISGSTSAVQVAAKFRTVAVPVVVLQVIVWDDMGLTSTPGFTTTNDQTQVTVTTNGLTSYHPITAGRRGTVTVSTTPGNLYWGVPPSSPLKSHVARLTSNTADYVIFAYDKGDTMYQLNAPARRVALGFKDEILNSLTADGAALFDAAIEWSTKVNLAPAVSVSPPYEVVTFGNAAPLNGSVTDDGLPNGSLPTASWSVVSGPQNGIVTFGDPNAAVTTASFSLAGTYVLRLTGSDGSASSTADITVLANTPPVVGAGSDLAAKVSIPIALDGTVTDDTVPSDPPASTTWSVVSGPGTVTFGDASAVDTTATFAQDGTYVLRLTATDGYLTASDEATFVVTNDPPVVSAALDQTVRIPNAVALHGTVTDSTIPNPPGVVTATWSQASGPGTTTFANAAAADTTATFSLEGTYVLRLTGSDGEFSTSDDVTLTVQVEGNPAVLLVTGAASNAGDTALQGRLQQLGYAVVAKTDATATAGDATGKDVVLLTGSLDPSAVGTKFRAVAVPVLAAQPFLFDEMGFTGPSVGADQGVLAAQTQVQISDPTHPLAAGLSGTVTVVTEPKDIGWGAAKINAAWVASTATGTSHPTLFAFEAGAQMAISRLTAPARRAGLFLYGDTAARLTPEGWKVFDAVLHWTRHKVAAPSIQPGTTTFSSVPQPVSLSCATAGAQVRYTTDSSDPRTSPTAITYGQQPVSISTTTTLKVFALKAGWDSSDVVTAVYTVSLGVLQAPTITPPTGEHPGTQVQVSISGDPNDTIHYTTNGGVPTELSAVYSTPFTVTDTTTVRARAFRTDWTPSAATTATIGFDPDGDGLTNAQELQLSTDPNNKDTNGDGIDDGAEVAMGLSPTNLDMDGDGVGNATERVNGTDPFKADTDGDGTPDGADCFPLDPTKQCPGGTSGDTMPPTITLSQPPGATLVP